MQTVEVMGDRESIAEPGRLAQAIVDYGVDFEAFSVQDVRTPQNADFLVYCRRSDTTLGAAVSFCHENRIPLALLSSGINADQIRALRFPLIKVPNASLPIVRFLLDVEEAALRHKNWPVTITEHHQPTKKDVSGTALKIADMLGVGKEAIVSVRNWEQSQREHNIPEETREGYAIHDVTFTNPETNIDTTPLHVVVHGRETYARGLMTLAGAVLGHPEEFLPGHYNIVDLVREHVL